VNCWAAPTRRPESISLIPVFRVRGDLLANLELYLIVDQCSIPGKSACCGAGTVYGVQNMKWLCVSLVSGIIGILYLSDESGLQILSRLGLDPNRAGKVFTESANADPAQSIPTLLNSQKQATPKHAATTAHQPEPWACDEPGGCCPIEP
jgi:hypothetical protein